MLSTAGSFAPNGVGRRWRYALGAAAGVAPARPSFCPAAVGSTTNSLARWPGRVVEWSSVNDVRLILTCGLPGSGKTTLASNLATSRGAVRLTKDEWHWALGSTPWDRDLGARLERKLWALAEETLTLGLSVVLDFGLWGRSERDELREAARRLGVGVELHFLDVPVDELWRRVEPRNSAPPWDEAPITRAHLDEWQLIFDAPDAAELALFDSTPG